jgi:hypothetical protein
MAPAKGKASQKSAPLADIEAPAEDHGKKAKAKRMRSSQENIDEAADDAANEASVLSGEPESDGAEGAGGSKRQFLPVGLLERRLDKANSEKTEMATKISELEKRLASAESPRPRTEAKAGPKVEHRLIL